MKKPLVLLVFAVTAIEAARAGDHNKTQVAFMMPPPPSISSAVAFMMPHHPSTSSAVAFMMPNHPEAFLS